MDTRPYIACIASYGGSRQNGCGFGASYAVALRDPDLVLILRLNNETARLQMLSVAATHRRLAVLIEQRHDFPPAYAIREAQMLRELLTAYVGVGECDHHTPHQ
jgi:hypothetical protein